MRPIKLVMQAFGSYADKTEIDFTVPNQNFFLITGDTGAGKTTIFDALVFALYGEASSGANRKDGAELQSQYAGLETEPFVELTFSERKGGADEVYKVRRSPRHFRLSKRKVKNPIQDVSESVALTLPGGSVMEGKTGPVNEKIEEIVGLTKGQFMQVVMIAQGEFMDLLRAKSSDKKIIFRKLFGTGLYEDLTDELDRRRKDKMADMARIRSICQTEAAHAVIPEDYERAQAAGEARDRLIGTDRLSGVIIDAFCEELALLCAYLAEQRDQTSSEYEKAGENRNARRDEYTRAEQLTALYQQLDKAKEELAVCEALADQMAEKDKLRREIVDAYEILAVYRRYHDADQKRSRTVAQHGQLTSEIPSLEAAERQTADAESAARQEYEAALSAYTKEKERADKALAVFDRIKAADKEIAKRAAILQKASGEALRAAGELEAQEKEEQAKRQQVLHLDGADKRLELCDMRLRELNMILREMSDKQRIDRELKTDIGKLKNLRDSYIASRGRFNAESSNYQAASNSYLDQQAGILAAELKPGVPCPVCGSTHHPAPCAVRGTAAGLTREKLDQMRADLDKLRRDMDQKAEAAHTASSSLEERNNALRADIKKLVVRTREAIPDLEEGLTLSGAQEQIRARANTAAKEREKLRLDALTLQKVAKWLENADNVKRNLQVRRDSALKAETEAKAALAAAKSARSELEIDQDYPSEEAARSAIKQKETVRSGKEEALRKASTQAASAKTQRIHTQSLIAQCEKDIPVLTAETEERKREYGDILAQKAGAETWKAMPADERKGFEDAWKATVSAYVRDEADRLQAEINRFNSRRASAKGRMEAAQNAVNGRPRPVIGELAKALKEAEEQLLKVQDTLEKQKAALKADTDVYKALSSRKEERSALADEFRRLEKLYNRFSGKTKGARMDIETFVQRYYLERILSAANRRFRDMSAGQFELRMYDIDKAGEGKNRGLDLMVYSEVTGKEREVRTLSGGESFMAALALALGTADQIKASSTAINLDVMFIDEGFGSLDDLARSQAVKVLQRMAGDSKLIGIISHVTELKNEMEDQLIVTKDEHGSSVKWQVS